MNIRREKIKNNIIIIFSIWATLSLFGSAIKADEDNCNKTYSIEYILYINAFCEVEK